ncbi:ABC transporter ATP-binding protein [Salinarimonas sp.]|uniref:ABC transporter ATP-binding protein n=1 Tax=Salinarimonas sp. TaxID=2766526 RepID=UPI0032D8EF2F
MTTHQGTTTHEDSRPVLSIRDLAVALPAGADRRYAVEGVSFDVGPGEIVCVVGESGSGKSVTAFSVMGLLPKGELAAERGEILLEGENVLEASPERLRDLRGTRMAMIFQEPATALNPVMTIGDQIDEVLQIHTGLSPAERREKVIAIMEAMHLPDPQALYDRYPHQLSGGQRQRVMIAAAMVLDPVILIADEPTTALDVTTQAQILQLIKEMQERRRTGVLFITHDFGVVAEIADKVVVMRHGKVVEQGPAREIFRNPKVDYTKMLIASVPSLEPPARKAASGEVAVRTRDLVKGYGGKSWLGRATQPSVLAAKDVNLVVRRGETLGVVGESGSGKSTVARCIVRLVDPTSGAIEIAGVDIAGLSTRALTPYRRRVQMVFQDPYRSLNPRRSVGASVMEGPMNFGLPREEALARARRLMSLVGLSPDALDRYPHQFSGGQRQRIAIARALAMEPDVLIADEAVSALDVSVQKQVLELLDQVKREFDLALLFITHDLRVAAQICDRIAVMRRGEVVEEGPTRELFLDPKHEYTRALLAAAPGRHLGDPQAAE